jgi:hypothetical protein
MSASLQMGKIINIGELLAAIQGTEDPDRAILNFASSLFGVAASTGTNMARAALIDSPSSSKWIRVIPSLGIRNISRFVEAVTTSKLTNAKGETLVNFDFRNPEHIAEVMAMLMGAQPTRLNRRYEALTSAHDFVRYHLARREKLMAEYALAVYNRHTDPQELEDAKKEIREYNNMVRSDKDLAPFAITSKQLAESLNRRYAGMKLREAGLPTQRSLVDIHMRFLRAYGIAPTLSQPQQ